MSIISKETDSRSIVDFKGLDIFPTWLAKRIFGSVKARQVVSNHFEISSICNLIHKFADVFQMINI